MDVTIIQSNNNQNQSKNKTMRTASKMKACAMSIIAAATMSIIFTACNDPKPADTTPVDTVKEQPADTSAAPAPADTAAKDTTVKHINEASHESK